MRSWALRDVVRHSHRNGGPLSWRFCNEHSLAKTPLTQRFSTKTSMSVVYHGGPGSLTHLAAKEFFRGKQRAVLSPSDEKRNVFDQVAKGETTYGIVPLENSASGMIQTTMDLMVEFDVKVGAEIALFESYCLVGKPGVQLEKVGRVLSHPRVTEACSSYLSTKLPAGVAGEMNFISTATTTEAATLIATENVGQGDIAAAAICTQEAAEQLGLDVLAEDIGNDKFLQTRYIAIHNGKGFAAERPPPMPHDKALELQHNSRKRSGAFVLHNEPGALFKLLSCWGLRGINVEKIESRPIHAGMPKAVSQTTFLWEFFVYVEYEVPLSHTKKQHENLWSALCEFSLWQRDYGIYPSHMQRMRKEAQSWDDMVDLMLR